MRSNALAGLKVVDLTHYVAGPYCTKLLAGFGADVIKVERPGSGDGMRQRGPFVCDERNPETSIPFLWLNTGKKSATLNLKSSAGVEVLKKMIGDADVLVENFSPRVMPGLGLDYATLQKINPRLVMVSISNFGQSGPYRDYKADEIGLQAMSGMMHMTGDPEKEPLATGPSVCQYSAGMHAYTAILMALFQREATGTGQHVDVSIMECSLEHIELTLSNHLHTGKNPRRGPHLLAPWDMYMCRDGYAAVISAPMRHWWNAVDMFEEPRLKDDGLKSAVGRSQRCREVNSLVQPWLSRTDKHDVFRMGQERGLAFGFLATLDEVVNSPQHEERQFIAEIDHPVAGKRKYFSAPFKMSQTPWSNCRAPMLGEHNDEIYRDRMAYSDEEIRRMRDERVI